MFRICSFQGTVLSSFSEASGDKEIRTLDPLLARQVLSQLSYIPVFYCLPNFSLSSGLKWTFPLFTESL